MPYSNQFVFIAVGGTGARVAQALVNLLTIGLPAVSRKGDDEQLRGSASTQDVLKIWRLDPDGQNGGAQALEAFVTDYHRLQRAVGLDPKNPSGDRLFSLKVETPKLIDPTEGFQSTLRGILNTNSHEDVKHILRLFYSSSDLDLNVRRGFYQKPFIGSAVLANECAALKNALSTCEGGAQDRQTRFFVCGSLFGGTGASGVPVIGRLLKDKANGSWKIGGAVVGPYFDPPPAPNLAVPEEIRKRIEDAVDVDLDTEEGRWIVGEVLKANPESKLSEEEVGQVLGKYFADPKGAANRAAASLLFYLRYAGEIFDRLYFLENPARTPLADHGVEWSNGGTKQRNPSHSLEYATALATLDFFTREDPDGQGARCFDIPAIAQKEFRGELTLQDLPVYSDRDPLQWIATACIALQIYRHHLAIAADRRADELQGTGFSLLERSFAAKPREWAAFQSGTRAFFGHLEQAIRRMSPSGGTGEDGDPTRRTVGWKTSDFEEALALIERERPLPDTVGGGLFSRGKEPEPVAIGAATAIIKLNKDVRALGGERAVLGTQPVLEFVNTLWAAIVPKVSVRQ